MKTNNRVYYQYRQTNQELIREIRQEIIKDRLAKTTVNLEARREEEIRVTVCMSKVAHSEEQHIRLDIMGKIGKLFLDRTP